MAFSVSSLKLRCIFYIINGILARNKLVYSDIGFSDGNLSEKIIRLFYDSKITGPHLGGSWSCNLVCIFGY